MKLSLYEGESLAAQGKIGGWLGSEQGGSVRRSPLWRGNDSRGV